MAALELDRSILPFLESNRLRHLVHLKFLHLYPDAISGIYCEVGREVGVVLHYPTTLASKDAENYPQTERVFLPVASGAAAALLLTHQMKRQYKTPQKRVFKFCNPQTRDVFVKAFRLQYAKTVISYTITQFDVGDLPENLMTASTLTAACANLYIRNGYTRAELDKYFADGAESFSMYEDSEPVCSCFTYRNFDDVWEVAGLHTLESARRKGYARMVVKAALSRLLALGRTPRYQVEADNQPSVELAESLGLTRCLDFEHYLTPAETD